MTLQQWRNRVQVGDLTYIKVKGMYRDYSNIRETLIINLYIRYIH